MTYTRVLERKKIMNKLTKCLFLIEFSYMDVIKFQANFRFIFSNNKKVLNIKLRQKVSTKMK